MQQKRNLSMAKPLISFFLLLAFVIGSLSLPLGSITVKAATENCELAAGIYFYYEVPPRYEDKTDITWEKAIDGQNPIIKLDNNDKKIIKFDKDRLVEGTYGYNGTYYKIIFKDGITEIGNEAFHNKNEKLKEVYATNSLTTIGDGAFKDCTKLETVTIGDDIGDSRLKTIGKQAFSGCSSLQTITIPNQVTTIGDNAFENCTNLNKVNIASDRITINNVFKDSTNVFLDNRSKTIEFALIDDIDSVDKFLDICKKITVPNNSGETNSQLGEGVNYTVSAEQKLDPVTIISPDVELEVPEASLTIGNTTFSPSYQWYKVNGETRTPIEGATNADLKFKLDGYGSHTFIREVSWGDIYHLNQSITVTYAKEYVKYTNANNQETVISWEDAVYKKYIRVDENSKSFVRGSQYSKSPLKDATKIEIVAPDSIKKVGNEVFKGCNSLKEVILSEKITEIGESAFSGCKALEKVDLPESLTSIGNSAFFGCIALKTINLPEKLTSIGQYAFFGCDDLETINLPENLTSIGNSAFSGCIALKTITIPDNVTIIGACAFFNCTELDKITIGTGSRLISIGNSAFGSCQFKEITLPDGIENIEESTFKNCNALTKITLPENLKNIRKEAFEGCKNLTEITLPNGVTSIEESTFKNCNALKTINLPENLTSIGQSAFFGCVALETINLPESLTSIGQSAFYDCDALETINLPESLTSIGQSAFSGCNALEKITLPNTTMTIEQNAFNGSGIATVTLPAGTDMQSASGMYATVNNAFGSSSTLWRLEIPVSEEITVGETLQLEASNDTGAVYSWYKVTDEDETEIAEASEADLKVEATTFPASVTPYTLIRKAEEPSASTTIYHRITLTVKAVPIVLPPAPTHEHTAIVQNKKAATCTQDGYTGDTVCSVCGAVLQKGETIPATHQLKQVKAKKATVAAAGNVEYYICEACQKLFADETAQKEVTKEEVTVPLALKKGEKVKTKDGVSYQVTDVKKQEVAYVAPNKKAKAKNIRIPSKVDIGGKTYKVVRIKKNAFKNNKTVTKIVIPSTVTYIENDAFANCKNLKTLEIKTTKLNKNNVASKAFRGIKKNVTIKVPQQKKKAYRSLLCKKGLSKENKIKKL